MGGWFWSVLTLTLALSTMATDAQVARSSAEEKAPDAPSVIETGALSGILTNGPLLTPGPDGAVRSLFADSSAFDFQPEGKQGTANQGRGSASTQLRTNPWFVTVGFAQGHILPNTSVLSHR